MGGIDTNGSNEELSYQVDIYLTWTQSLGAQLGSTYPPGLGLNAPKCATHQDHHELVCGTHFFSERFRELPKSRNFSFSKVLEPRKQN